MKKIIAIICLTSLLSGCATMRRHPVATGIIIGAGVGIGMGIATHRGSCPHTYDGQPYSGTPPCPK